MTAKAYRMTVPLLKSICDFFCVDRSGPIDKEQLVERMLEFLRAPSVQGTKHGKSNTRKRSIESDLSEQQRKVKKIKVHIDDDETENEDTEDEQEVKQSGNKKEVPTNDMLKAWVKAYCTCFNLDKVTTKHAMETVSDKFGMDLSSMKENIRGLLTEEMESMRS